MSELKSLVVLQARVYEFLAQQDEATLQALVSGAAELSAVGAEVVTPKPDGLPPVPSLDPLEAAQHLSRPATVQDRRNYLARAKFSVPELRRVVKALGMRNYSNLRRTELIDRLVSHGPGTPPQVSPSPDPVGDVPAQPTSAAPPEPPKPSPEIAAIALRLRETETEEEGAAYLREQGLDRDGLLAVAAELGLTRLGSLRQVELEKRVLKQAIGARRKFAGLRRW